MLKSAELREQKAPLLEKMTALVDQAENEKRNLNESENSEFETLTQKVKDLDQRIKRSLDLEAAKMEEILKGAKTIGSKSEQRDLTDKTGNPVQYRSKKNNVKFVESLGKDEQRYSLGRVIRAMALGKPSIAEYESRAMSTTGASAAVPAAVAQSIIDYAFEQSVIMQAGATMVQMPAKTITFPRFTDVGALEFKAENAAFSGDDMSIDGVTLTAQTLGQYFTISRELMEDGLGIEEAINRQLGNLLANALDNYAINGTGSDEPTGILATTNVQSIASFGAVDGWGFGLQAWKKLADEGFSPNAILLNPATVESLDETIMDSYRERPEAIRTLPRYVTSKLADNGGTGTNESTALLGDFTSLLWGVRAEPQIEVSNFAGDAFAKHQYLIKITWRGDFGVSYPKAFCKVTGMTF